MPNLRKTSDLAAQRRGVGSGANDPKSFIRAPVGGFDTSEPSTCLLGYA